MTTRTGIVLAGGFSRRFGDDDKTLADLDGKSLLSHAVDALAPAVGRVVVSCRAEQVDAFSNAVSADFVTDPVPDEGPLAGLAAALEEIEADAVAVTTADKPCVPTACYRALFDRLESEGVVVDDGMAQPAPAVYRTAPLRAVVAERRAAGDSRFRSILSALDLATVEAAWVETRWGEDALADVNTREKLAALRERK